MAGRSPREENKKLRNLRNLPPFWRDQLLKEVGKSAVAADFAVALVTAYTSIGCAGVRCRGVRKKVSFLVRKCSEQPHQFLRFIKTQLGRLRVAVLENRDWWQHGCHLLPKNLRGMRAFKVLQFTHLARALPVPPQWYGQKQLDELLDRICTPVKACTRPSIYRAITAVCRDIRVADFPEPSVLGSASCLQAKRSDGGISSVTNKRLEPFAVLAKTPEPRTSFNRGPKVLASHWGPRFASQGKSISKNLLGKAASMCDEAWEQKKDSIPSSSFLAVRERGYKVRAVTVSDYDLVAQGHKYRKAYFPVLSSLKNVTTSESLRDPDLNQIKFSGSRRFRRRRYVFSADFSTATDGLKHCVLRHACECLNLDTRVVFEGHRVNGRLTLSGAFMGLPMSWTLLSILHYAVARMVDPEHNFRIKGDDLIALWSKAQIALFRQLSADIGLVVNDKSATSSDKGTFCEGMYSLHGRTLVRLPTFSIRSFVEGSILQPDQLLSLARRNVSFKNVAACQRILLWRRCKAPAKRNKISLTVPTYLGGLGLVPNQPRALVKDPKAQAAFVAAHNGKLILPVGDQTKSSGLTAKVLAAFAQQLRWTYAAPEHQAQILPRFKRELARRVAALSVHDVVNGSALKVKAVSRPIKDAIRAAKAVRFPPSKPTAVTTYRMWELASQLTPVRSLCDRLFPAV